MDDLRPSEQPSGVKPSAEPAEKVIRGGDIVGMLVGGFVYIVVAGSGVLHVLAATRVWNPFHWQGQLLTGVFMVLAPTALAVMAALPYRIRQKMPESVVAVGTIGLWIAFFWAACGGH